MPLARILIFSVKLVPLCVLNIKSAEAVVAFVQIAFILTEGLHSFDKLNPKEHAVPTALCLELIKLSAHNSVAPPESPLNIATDDLLVAPLVLVPGPTCKGTISVLTPVFTPNLLLTNALFS